MSFTPPPLPLPDDSPYLPAQNVVTSATKVQTANGKDYYVPVPPGPAIAVPAGTPMKTVLADLSEDSSWQKFRVATVNPLSDWQAVNAAHSWWITNVLVPNSGKWA